MVDITEISAIVAAAGILVGVVYYILDIRNQTKLRQTDLVMRLYSTFNSMEFLEAWGKVYFAEYKNYDDFLKKLEGKREIAMLVFRFYEQVGVLLRRKLIDIDLIDILFGNNTIITWEKTKGTILREMRERINPRAYESFEYLYNEMKKREQQASKTVRALS